MREESPQGLTAQDFHHQAYIDPRDVFQVKSRQANRPSFRPFSPNGVSVPQITKKSLSSPLRLSCCGEDVIPNEGNLPAAGCPLTSSTDIQTSVELSKTNGPTSVSTGDTDDCDSCENCIEDHKECDKDEIQCIDECDQCFDEHDQLCGQHGQVCTETCDDCDFSCFDCIDWNAFERDKSLGLSFSVPLLDHPDDTIFHDSAEIAEQLPSVEPETFFNEIPVAPLELPMHHQCVQNGILYWNEIRQANLCSPTSNPLPPNLQLHLGAQCPPGSLPYYGCHPATIHYRSSSNHPIPHEISATNYTTPSAILQELGSTSVIPSMRQDQQTSVVQTNKICEWIMPCGTTCSASFATTADLKKHLKSVHIVKGRTDCGWRGCEAKFASEAALTGHISKKHISTSTDDDGPFKCTFPGCSKSFMYKQVRDEHVASHNGNKMYCHICDQFLNSEGSNFRRHMASHRPKHQHMLCKHHHLGCKRRFPRLDNLRRHEACCKYGKKAALHHHHHHRHVGR